MRTRLSFLAAGVAACCFALTNAALAQAPAALTGQISSAKEGAMEGVVVSAKRQGSTIMVSVDSNEQGQFSFPKDRLEPGTYDVTMRAIGYVLPPTSLLQTAHADQLYIVSRTTTTLDGVRDTCDSQKGTANIAAFDNHVVGCHVQGGADCAAADYQFVDQNRTIYSVTSATFEAKVVPDNATCADVRAALPAQ